MSIILKTEKKNWSSRFIYLIMYIMLCIGASTMIYPFLLMVSGSFKSRIDANEFNLVPTFLHDNNMLFKKQQESKYNENLQMYLLTNNEKVITNSVNKITRGKFNFFIFIILCSIKIHSLQY